jgi:hypothetical protein
MNLKHTRRHPGRPGRTPPSCGRHVAAALAQAVVDCVVRVLAACPGVGSHDRQLNEGLGHASCTKRYGRELGRAVLCRNVVPPSFHLKEGNPMSTTPAASTRESRMQSS